MSGCEGCFQSAKGMQEQLSITRSKAKQYAKEEQKTVAIYREGFDFRYCDEEVARREGYDIVEILSKHQ
jgi:hypothetical protein